MANAQELEEAFTIQQVAQITRLSPHTLRYYERAGLMKQRVERDDSSGYRLYTSQDIQWIEFLKCLRSTGMPIRDVQSYADLLRQGDTTIIERLQLLKDHRLRVQQQLDEVEQHLSHINKKITTYENFQLKQLKAENI